jgi:hypothetical protein
VIATGGETIASLTIDAPGGFGDLRQPRISGATVENLPEPASLMIFTGVAAALAFGRRGRRRGAR